MSFLLVANFKSHKTQDEVKSWLQEVVPVAKNSPAIVIIAPSFVHLNLVKDITLAAQDVSSFPQGSYTGAVNAKQLKDLGVTYCLIGHSERRRHFHETATEIASKAEMLLEENIIPILCLAKDDIQAQRASLSDSIADKCYFCYEPPADIGGTETASVQDIKATTDEIKQIFGTTKVMYGGSVNADNLAALLPLNLSGVLVASASLSAASFTQIIAQAHVKI